jgi:DNA replication initiation complex subunit (GINS family)
MNNNTTNKFTATLVNEATKQLVVELRDQANLSEKELMALIVDIALESRDRILETAAVINKEAEEARIERNKQAYELRKQAMQKVRDAIKAAKPAKPSKPSKEPKPVKAEVTEQVTA